MKKFVAPVVEIMELKIADVITTSCTSDNAAECEFDAGGF